MPEPLQHLGRDCSRRDFLALGASCSAHLLLLARAHPVAAARVWGEAAARRVVAREPWGRIERVAPGVWALVSTPLEDRLTLCNAAIVAGNSRVVVVEASASVGGASWLLQQAAQLAGRPVDDVIVTHYHADHTGGIGAGGVSPSPAGGIPALPGASTRPASPLVQGGGTSSLVLQATPATIELVRADDVRRQRSVDPERSAALAGAARLSPERTTELDLGGRTLRVVPRTGHTASDVSIELDDPSVVVTGDLLWNGMFPNYVDALPSALARSVRALVRERETVYVPGHGALADTAAVARYLEVLDLVEAAARQAHQRGVPAAEAAKTFALPASLGEWYMFSPRFYEVALGAWERELGTEGGPQAAADGARAPGAGS